MFNDLTSKQQQDYNRVKAIIRRSLPDVTDGCVFPSAVHTNEMGPRWQYFVQVQVGPGRAAKALRILLNELGPMLPTLSLPIKIEEFTR